MGGFEEVFVISAAKSGIQSIGTGVKHGQAMNRCEAVLFSGLPSLGAKQNGKSVNGTDNRVTMWEINGTQPNVQGQSRACRLTDSSYSLIISFNSLCKATAVH